MSAPPVYGHRECMKELAYKDFPMTPRTNNFPTMTAFLNAKSNEPTSMNPLKEETKLPRITLKTPGNSEGPLHNDRLEELQEEDEGTVESESVTRMDSTDSPQGKVKDLPEGRSTFYQKTGKDFNLQRPKSEGSFDKENRVRLARKQFGNAPFIKPRRVRVDSAHERTTELPPFVQVETLHQGQTFVSHRLSLITENYRIYVQLLCNQVP